MPTGKILVTGSAGLIGFILSEKLKQQGYEIIDCDIRFNNKPLDFASENIIDILKQCDGIIHLAAISRVIDGEKHPELCQKINLNNTLKFLEYYNSLTHKPWLIYGSSREVYGQQVVLPVHENAHCNPINIYAKCKRAIEKHLSTLQQKNNNILILRFSNVYGGMLDHYNRVVPAFCLNALTNNTISVEGGECVFDFTYVYDVVDGIYLAVNKLQKGKLVDSIIQLTSNKGCSLTELAKLVLDITDSGSKIEYYPARDFDVGKFYGHYQVASQCLGWTPKYSLEEGLTRFIHDLKNSAKQCPYSITMEIYENIKSYSWLPALL